MSVADSVVASDEDMPRGLLQAWDRAGPQRTQRELAHQLHRLAGIGVLKVADAVLAADHFLLLTSGAVSERSHCGAAALSAPARAALITAGVRALLHGYLPERVAEGAAGRLLRQRVDAARSKQLMTPHLGALNEFCWMDLKTYDVPGTAAFFSTVLGWRFAVDEDDWRRATKIFANGHQIGGVSDLSGPLYPPGTPSHIAYYLAVDDIEARAEAAMAAGAHLVLAPFDAGDQGCIATLIDPVGAVFSLWQTHPSNRWLPSASAPQRMILVCPHPERARRFYRDMLGTVPSCADFVLAHGPEGCAPRWELAVGVEDPDTVAARARGLGQEVSYRPDHAGLDDQRLSSPEGLTFRVRADTS